MWVKSIKKLNRREVGLVLGAIAVCGVSAWAIGQAVHPSGPTIMPSQPSTTLGQLPLPDAAPFLASKPAAVGTTLNRLPLDGSPAAGSSKVAIAATALGPVGHWYYPSRCAPH